MKTPIKITTDKWLHLIVGTMIYLVLLMFFSPKTAIITTGILAFLKEVNDRGRWLKFLLTSNNRKGTFDYWDFVFSIIIPLIISSIIAMQ